MDSAALAAYGLEAMDSYNSSDHSPRVLDIKISGDVGIGASSIPTTIKVSAPYPNPFNPQTVIKIELQEYTFLNAAVFDINGRIVKNIFSGYKFAGDHEIVLQNGGLSSGIYFIKVWGQDFSKTAKVVLLK
jgi:hypothetical protein